MSEYICPWVSSEGNCSCCENGSSLLSKAQERIAELEGEYKKAWEDGDHQAARVNDLEAENSRLQEELNVIRKENAHLNYDLHPKLIAENASLLSEIQRLREELKNYCRHGAYCEMRGAIPADEEEKYKCTCGLKDALARGYCSERNSGKILDADLIMDMTEEVLKALEAQAEVIRAARKYHNPEHKRPDSICEICDALSALDKSEQPPDTL